MSNVEWNNSKNLKIFEQTYGKTLAVFKDSTISNLQNVCALHTIQEA